MKKFFSFILALTAAVAVNATKVEFDFSSSAAIEAMGLQVPEAGKGTVITGQEVTVDGVTMTGTKGTTDFRIYNSNGTLSLRVYKTGGSITFAAAEDITAIEFVGTAVNFNEFSGKTWAGTPAKSVTLTAKENCTISTITLTVGEAAVIWTPDTISTAEAIQLAKDGDKNDHFVIGVVHGEPFCTYAFKDKVSFWMHDVANAADTLEFYDGMGLDNQKWESLDAAKAELRIGDTILVYAGGLSPYHPKEAAEGVYIYEITGGYYVEKLGANPNPPAILGPDTITTAQALAIAKALAKPSANGQSTTDTKEYVVGGYAVQVYDKNSDGTWSFFMADEEGAYGEFQASNATTDKDVVKGDYMYLRGYIAHRLTSGGKDQYQIYLGTAAHGEPLVIEAIEVDVAGAMAVGNALEDNATTGDVYKVLGYVAKVSTAFDEEEGIETFFMSDDPEATFGDFQARLVTIAAPGAKVGDYVAVVGPITKYVGASGSPTIQIDHGKAEVVAAQGIENITLTEKAQKVVVDGVIYIVRDNKMFNLQGAQVR